MNDYMLMIDLPAILENDFLSRIPAQRSQINRLMSQGVISSYNLALDRSKLWVTFRARDTAAVEEVFASFPLYDFMEGTIIPLMFHQSLGALMPKLSMN